MSCLVSRYHLFVFMDLVIYIIIDSLYIDKGKNRNARSSTLVHCYALSNFPLAALDEIHIKSIIHLSHSFHVLKLFDGAMPFFLFNFIVIKFSSYYIFERW